VPTYRYECASCEAIHEYFHSMSEKPKSKCPDCGGRLERLIGRGGGVLLKGSGFHNTDYRSESYRAAEKKDSPASGKKDGAKKDAAKKDGAKKDGAKPPKKNF
jgi:putative FmdB family regulatory protein